MRRTLPGRASLMVNISVIAPLDQPLGRRRLLEELKDALRDEGFSSFQFIVAFAKAGPLLRLKSLIDQCLGRGLRIDAIFGLDQQGTTAQALTFALDHFSTVYVTREPNLTFHPKIYMFLGSTQARVFVGSNNLTVGGTETNFEGTVRLDLQLPAERESLLPFEDLWKELLPAACPATKVLNRTLLEDYVRDGTVPDEKVLQQSQTTKHKSGAAKATRSGLKVKPPSALPSRKPAKPKGPSATAAAAPSAATPYSAQGLAIQIKPHHNGEIFLSVTAALQNPAFFKWPFTGATIPKKSSNVSYPQLTPDPRVNIVVYGKGQAPLLTLPNYALNTVYYEKKSEIRITASPLVSLVPDYSVMIMRSSEAPDIDYDIEIHRPDSPDYAAWIAACNQSMPGGGKAPRKFGWF